MGVRQLDFSAIAWLARLAGWSVIIALMATSAWGQAPSETDADPAATEAVEDAVEDAPVDAPPSDDAADDPPPVDIDEAADAPIEDPPIAAPPKGPTPLSVTISGGGTKGAYMAGQLYYAQRLFALNDGALEPRVYTGASAGAMNSVTALMAQWGPAAADPQDSLFWSIWIPVGINELFLPEHDDETALLSRRGFEAPLERLRALWNAGLPRDCDMLIGIAISRLSPRYVSPAPGFPALPRTLETVLLRVTGQGPGRPPRLRNHVDAKAVVPQLILPLDGPDADAFAALESVVLASAAFPVGFMPVDVPHCMTKPGTSPRCTPADAKTAQFIDGGVFANQPLGLSVRAMRSVVRLPDGRLGIADQPRDDFLPEASFQYIDPRVTSLSTGPAEEQGPPAEGVFAVLASMLHMVDTVQSAELLAVFDREPRIRDRLVMTSRRLPHVSSTFTGLLDERLRVFDFYLGMYDAARAARAGGLGPADRLPESVGTPAGWQPFACLRALYDGHGHAQHACSGAELEDFRILAQVTQDRQQSLCVSSGADHEDCRPGKWDRPVPGVAPLDISERLRRDGEGELEYLLRLLAAYRFHFEDLGLERDEADEVRYHLTRLAQDMVGRLAAGQPSNSLPLAVIGRVGVDVGVGYVPPVHIFHLSLGLGAEFGYSLGIDHPMWSWLRFTAALELDGFSSLLNDDDNYVALRPKLGLEVEPIGGAYAQLRLGTRAGYQLSTGDSFTSTACDFANEDRVPCSRFMTEAYVATSLLGLVRLHVAGIYLPPIHAMQTAQFGVRPMIGVQLNSPF